MKEKFQKLFGPQATEVGASVPSFADDMNEASQQRRIARLALRRRLLGLAALVLFVLVVAPAFFEPDMTTADRTALTVIPPMKDVAQAVEVAVAPLTKSQTPEVSATPTADEKSVRSTAKALSAANPVAAGMREAPGVADGDAAADPIGTLLDKKAPAPKKAEPPAPKADAKGARITKDAERMEAAKTEAKAPERKPAAGVRLPIAADPAGRWYIQIFATANKTAAENKVKQLQKQGLPAYIEPVKRRSTTLWRVRAGRFGSLDDARAAHDVLALLNESNGGISQLAAEKK